MQSVSNTSRFNSGRAVFCFLSPPASLFVLTYILVEEAGRRFFIYYCLSEVRSDLYQRIEGAVEGERDNRTKLDLTVQHIAVKNTAEFGTISRLGCILCCQILAGRRCVRHV